MKALSVGAPLRGVAAFVGTLALGLIALNVAIAIYFFAQFGSWSFSGVITLSMFALIFAAPLSVLICLRCFRCS